MPRIFSRYSTLSEDRRYVQSPATARPSTAGAGAGAGSGGGGADDGTDSDSPIRYLALCRVIVNKVFVTSKDHEVRAMRSPR